MKGDTATSDASPLRGYAWHVYPDPAAPGALAADSPFAGNDPRGPGRAPIGPPQGIVAFWSVSGQLPSLRNQVEDHAYLVLTRRDEPPNVGPGWFTETARLADSFELDQRGGRTARLLRVVRRLETEWGPLQD